ncbi:HD domain-containing protein [Mycena indigotica]|uniref:HD domain-containing protein n=1 Tax=Mycena indigotica TaxID=2126181 RepID=A0A8H6T954_9AGAR|nr:HD domain-containing protein [Mycena indigotica]KAF7312491.1 HD domain-containing protein [Mycena indigotica]
MYPSEQERVVIAEAEKVMQETMAKYDPSHDVFHVQRVRKTALSIANALPARNPDLLVVELAALLHDVLDKKYVSAEQAADPYAFFLPFFQSVKAKHGLDLISDGRAALVAKVVDHVSWTTETRLKKEGKWIEWHETCVELHCVQDADRLDAIGAFGVLRCAAYSAAVNRPLHVPITSPDALISNSAIGHFHEKLVLIRDRLKTEPGRLLGEKRHSVLVAFMDSVEEEYHNTLIGAEPVVVA